MTTAIEIPRITSASAFVEFEPSKNRTRVLDANELGAPDVPRATYDLKMVHSCVPPCATDKVPQGLSPSSPISPFLTGNIFFIPCPERTCVRQRESLVREVSALGS